MGEYLGRREDLQGPGCLGLGAHWLKEKRGREGRGWEGENGVAVDP